MSTYKFLVTRTSHRTAELEVTATSAEEAMGMANDMAGYLDFGTEKDAECEVELLETQGNDNNPTRHVR